MDRPIETTWKEGFLHADAMVAPAVNDLYGRRSVHLVDRIRRMLKINRRAVVIGAPVLWLLLSSVGIPYSGAIICVPLLALMGYHWWRFGDMQAPDNSLNSYEYLKAFQGWLKDGTAGLRRIQRHIYPLCFLAIAIGLGASRGGQALIGAFIENYPDVYLVGGVPAILLAGVLVATAAIAFLGGMIYDFDVNMFYRPVFRKLDEMVADMEELRADGPRDPRISSPASIR